MLALILPLVQSLSCDLSISSGICIYSNKNVIRPYPALTSLTGYWTFDDDLSLDYSGYSNHGTGAVSAGPSPMGQGSSSRFSGTFITVPSSPSLASKVFSVTFWLFVEQEDTINHTGLKWCPILQKGDDDEASSVFQRTPAIFFDREERQLQVFVSTTAEGMSEGEFLVSNARVPYNRWTHVAVIRETQKLTLYVNGVLDSSNSTEGWTVTNDSPLYIGNTPEKSDSCPVPILIDEVKFYNDNIQETDIFSETSTAFGQYESRFLKFGCAECSLDEANDSCGGGYHLCTTVELHSGGYSMIKALGWDQISDEVWSYSALSKKALFTGLGLGVCCLDLGY